LKLLLSIQSITNESEVGKHWTT